jgi:hypothetical protein
MTSRIETRHIRFEYNPANKTTVWMIGAGVSKIKITASGGAGGGGGGGGSGSLDGYNVVQGTTTPGSHADLVTREIPVRAGDRLFMSIGAGGQGGGQGAYRTTSFGGTGGIGTARDSLVVFDTQPNIGNGTAGETKYFRANDLSTAGAGGGGGGATQIKINRYRDIHTDSNKKVLFNVLSANGGNGGRGDPSGVIQGGTPVPGGQGGSGGLGWGATNWWGAGAPIPVTSLYGNRTIVPTWDSSPRTTYGGGSLGGKTAHCPSGGTCVGARSGENGWVEIEYDQIIDETIIDVDGLNNEYYWMVGETNFVLYDTVRAQMGGKFTFSPRLIIYDTRPVNYTVELTIKSNNTTNTDIPGSLISNSQTILESNLFETGSWVFNNQTGIMTIVGNRNHINEVFNTLQFIQNTNWLSLDDGGFTIDISIMDEIGRQAAGQWIVYAYYGTYDRYNNSTLLFNKDIPLISESYTYYDSLYRSFGQQFVNVTQNLLQGSKLSIDHNLTTFKNNLSASNTLPTYKKYTLRDTFLKVLTTSSSKNLHISSLSPSYNYQYGKIDRFIYKTGLSGKYTPYAYYIHPSFIERLYSSYKSNIQVYSLTNTTEDRYNGNIPLLEQTYCVVKNELLIPVGIDWFDVERIHNTFSRNSILRFYYGYNTSQYTLLEKFHYSGVHISKVTFNSPQNIINNSNFINGTVDGWYTDTSTVRDLGDSIPSNTRWCLSTTSRYGGRWLTAIPVVSGEKYYFSCKVYNTSNSIAAFGAYMTQDGLHHSSQGGPTSHFEEWAWPAYTDKKNTWIVIEGILTIPDNISYMEFWTFVDHDGDIQHTDWSDFTVYKVGNSVKKHKWLNYNSKPMNPVYNSIVHSNNIFRSPRIKVNIEVSAMGVLFNGEYPHFNIYIDDMLIGDTYIESSILSVYKFSGYTTYAKPHKIKLEYLNGDSNRNFNVSYISVNDRIIHSTDSNVIYYKNNGEILPGSEFMDSSGYLLFDLSESYFKGITKYFAKFEQECWRAQPIKTQYSYFTEFAAFNGGSFYRTVMDDPEQNWQYNVSMDQIESRINSTLPIGLVSPDRVTRHNLSAIVGSRNNDDDWVGLVIAFNRDNNTNRSIVARRAVHTTHPDATWELVLIVNNSTTVLWNGSLNISSTNPNGNNVPGWSSSDGVLISVRRNRNIVYLATGQFDRTTIDSTTETTIDLLSFNNPDIEYLINEASYGFYTHSQSNSFFKDIWINKLDAFNNLSTKVEPTIIHYRNYQFHPALLMRSSLHNRPLFGMLNGGERNPAHFKLVIGTFPTNLIQQSPKLAISARLFKFAPSELRFTIQQYRLLRKQPQYPGIIARYSKVQYSYHTINIVMNAIKQGSLSEKRYQEIPGVYYLPVYGEWGFRFTSTRMTRISNIIEENPLGTGITPDGGRPAYGRVSGGISYFTHPGFIRGYGDPNDPTNIRNTTMEDNRIFGKRKSGRLN